MWMWIQSSLVLLLLTDGINLDRFFHFVHLCVSVRCVRITNRSVRVNVAPCEFYCHALMHEDASAAVSNDSSGNGKYNTFFWSHSYNAMNAANYGKWNFKLTAERWTSQRSFPAAKVAIGLIFNHQQNLNVSKTKTTGYIEVRATKTTRWIARNLRENTEVVRQWRWKRAQYGQTTIYPADNVYGDNRINWNSMLLAMNNARRNTNGIHING